MADKKGLERIGMVFGLVAAIVMLIAAAVVKYERNGGPERLTVVSASFGPVVR
jgi:hypothetical protein